MQAKKLHLFFPENDLALARNIDNYTPPPAAARLRRSGEALPLWYGEAGDTFIASGINARWLDNIRRIFSIDMDVFDYRPDNLVPAPWGWSKASRREFHNIGFLPDSLPSDEALDRLRMLSHRRTAAAIRRELDSLMPGARLTPAPVECAGVSAVETYLDSTPEAIVKLPWSSSGRGIMAVDPSIRQHQISGIEGMIRRQGSVTCEPRLQRRSDFAFLFEMHGGKAAYCGLSLFETEGLGSYTGNILAPQEKIASFLLEQCDRETFLSMPEALSEALEKIIEKDYEGPLGIDMMTLTDSTELAMTELNLRMTMGHLCLRLYERHICPGAIGHFRISPRTATASSAKPLIDGGRLVNGIIELTPPGTDFVFTAEAGTL